MDKAITLETVTAGADRTVITTTETITTDGKSSEGLAASKKRKTMSVTNEGNKYTELTTMYDPADNQKVMYKITDTRHIENNQLILDRKDGNLTNGEVWESKATYTKN